VIYYPCGRLVAFAGEDRIETRVDEGIFMKSNFLFLLVGIFTLFFCTNVAQAQVGDKLPSRSENGPSTELALTQGLLWLKNHQMSDGSWSYDKFTEKCLRTPPCSGTGSGSGFEATGLALLAFLGAGNTHKYGKFKRCVKGAIKYLHEHQNPNGSFGKHPDGLGRDIRAHAVCTMAVAEIYGMSGRSPLFSAMAQRSVDFLVSMQKPEGGFGAKEGAPSDAVSTTWAVLALKSASLSRLTFPQSSFAGVVRWFDSVTDEKTHQVAMRVPLEGSAPVYSTKALACALISRIFTGAKKTSDPHLVHGGKLLAAAWPRREGGSGLDPEAIYFGTLAAFQLGRKVWDPWNPAMREAIVPSQVKEGCASGSWNPESLGKTRGRVWASALNVLSLEIYYRYARAMGKGR
jgi:hypothetical protein